MEKEKFKITQKQLEDFISQIEDGLKVIGSKLAEDFMISDESDIDILNSERIEIKFTMIKGKKKINGIVEAHVKDVNVIFN